jgi:nitrite reductase/ring-hydroxylating ferredoxin subunit
VRPDGGALVLVVAQGEQLHALADRCSHRGGPLHEGDIAEGCVTCPWHGSVFRLVDGEIERGPATQPQPVYEARVVDGSVQVRH